MTTEEKAKAYDEVREKIAIRFGSNVADEIFSQFEMSEDERIRKALRERIIRYDPNNEILIKEDGISQKQYLAWLEKQGEHANFRNKIQVGDKVTRNRDGVLVNLSQLNRVAKKDEKQGEQKPADKVEPKFKVKYANSEYNVLEIKEIAGVTYYGIEDEPNHIDYVLPDNCEIVSEQKTAWSEEDIICIDNLIAIIENRGYPDYVEYLEKLKDRVQPKSHWKPSNEQMNTLEYYMHTLICNEHKEILFGLYTDLKKLKEE